MVWTYLAESVESQSHSKTGLDPSPTAKLIPIVKESSCPELCLINLRMPPFGMILKHWKGLSSHGDMSILYLEASRVRTSALQDAEQAWKESEAAYFSRSCAWPKKSSPNFYSLKMSLPSQVEADLPLPEKLPKWGMIVDGVLYPLRPLERYTVGRGGFYWPTPQACDADKGPAKEYDPKGKQSSQRNLVTLAARFSTTGKILNPQFVEFLMGYPIGHTELEDWAIQWFRSNVKKRSKS
jgi:hypothetical protein